MLNTLAQMFRILHSIKSQRKCLSVLFVVLLILLFCCNNVVLGKCISDSSCMNGGVCINGTCVCPDGWQGDDCQFCGGKVRLTDFFGYIHDGAGNYSVGVKCSWLIDSREKTVHRNSLRGNDKPPTIRLHLEEFATECGWDHLYVFDGDSVESPLLAVYSGLMYSQNISVRRVPEVMARSGSVLLHFFSDDAYNMSGFNISYKINGCPTDNSSVNCSGHGVCNELDGTCDCDSEYYGFACQTPRCPKECSRALGQGQCDDRSCSCLAGFAGADCSQDVSLGYWTTITPDSFTPLGSASHCAAVWGDALHIIAGESYGRGQLLYTYDFNGKVWETVHSSGSTSPEMRYDASTVIYGDKIYMYGGVVGRKGVSNELWAFDVSAKTWENVTVKFESCTSSNTMCGPLKSSGHTATLVSGYDPIANIDYKCMIIIFGHSPQYGYLNTVQEYTFSSRTWKILTTYGYPVKGGYGHSADYDSLTNKVYIYGGIVSENENNQIISNNLYSYDPLTREWKLLTAAATGRFLHTANFISAGMMMVFGGNTHNDTSHSFGAKCYSNELMVYDVLCDTWHFQSMPDDFQTDIARFGHSAVKFSDSLYIYGGFDGQMLSDLLKYTPGNCLAFQKAEQCLNSRPGHKCVWDIQKSRCIPITHVQKDIIRARDQDVYMFCPKESRIVLTQQLLLDSTRCSELLDCHSCVSTSFGCTFCSTGICSKEKCRDFHSDGIPIQSVSISTLDKCPEDLIGLQCAQIHDCNACQSSSKCHWDAQMNKCRIASNRTVDDASVCSTPCADIKSCNNCTSEECIWCQNEERCVDKNAYTVSFPYGQCREWTTQLNKCRAPISGGKSQCEFYKSCSQCRDDPACGWCDDGSKTGLGKCLPGGASGPQELSECPTEEQWYFTRCPSCQCNGHSTCYDGKTCATPCDDLTHTTGANCELCRPGYWGNPINGGTCQKCECNGQATHCHPETAKCYCSTKGLTGDHCEKCDGTNHYHGDPSKGSCYYDLTIDYQFTFNLSKKEDRHFTQINFRNSPIKSDIDADFSILCSVAAKMNITIRSAGGPEKPIFSNLNCSQFRYRFSKTEHHFGIEDNVTLTTFYVYVYDFQPPVWIQIAFSQYPKLNLQQFFITFSTCFLLLLLLAAVLWKIKQKYDMYRRRQRLFVEMEQMASRPFSEVLVEIENRRADVESPTPVIENTSKAQRKRKKDAPSPIALEPCSGNRAAVLSLLVRLPSGGLNFSTCGQSTGLAIASALVTLGNPRKLSMEHPKETKNKRKQSQHPDNCI